MEMLEHVEIVIILIFFPFLVIYQSCFVSVVQIWDCTLPACFYATVVI